MDIELRSRWEEAAADSEHIVRTTVSTNARELAQGYAQDIRTTLAEIDRLNTERDEALESRDRWARIAAEQRTLIDSLTLGFIGDNARRARCEDEANRREARESP